MAFLDNNNSSRQRGNGSSLYGGTPQPSPARIRSEASSGPGPAQFLYPPRGAFVQQPGVYAGISHPGGVPFPGGFQLPGNTTSPSVITRTSQAPQGPRLRQTESSDWFRAVDQDGDGYISREELRMCSPVQGSLQLRVGFNYCDTGSALLNDRGLPFSDRVVEYLMRTFDSDGDGSISSAEFAHLWNFVIGWRQLFVEFDVDQDGSISADELAHALAAHNFHVGPPVLDLLLKKYGTPRQSAQGISRLQMTMDWFICTCIIVDKMWKLYDSIYRSADRPWISREEFLENVISLP